MSEQNINEKWRPVVGYEGIYSVSSEGRVRRDAPAAGATVGRILKPVERGTGYLFVCLKNTPQKPSSYDIHRIVADAFFGSRQHGKAVNHKNGNKYDNRASNLEYVTYSENMTHAVRVLGRKIGNRGETHHLCTLNSDAVKEIRCRQKAGEMQSTLAKEFSVDGATISNIVLRKTWKHIP